MRKTLIKIGALQLALLGTVSFVKGQQKADTLSTTNIQEVVVTALGINRQSRELGYATQVVSGKDLQTVKGVDLATSLTGKVAGLMVQNSSNFMAQPTITLRGATPLLVIDGVPYENLTLRDVPADNIQSIDFLKGATASALYGSRGGNGAIMITTKKMGSTNGLSVDFNSSDMFQAGYVAIPKMQDKFGRVVNTGTNTVDRSANGSWGAPLNGQSVIQWDPISKSLKAAPYLPIGKDNFKNFASETFVLNNEVSISQRGAIGGFRAAANWVQNKGAYPNSHYNQIGYSLAGDIKLGKFSMNTSMAYNKQYSPNMHFNAYTQYGPMYSMLIWGSPDWDVRQYKDYWLIPNQVQNDSYTAGNNNPYFDAYERVHTYSRDALNLQLTANYEFNDWLKATLRTGYDNYNVTQQIRISKGSFQGGGATTVLDGGMQVWGESQRGSYNVGNGRGFSTNTDLLLQAHKKVGDFDFHAFVGGSIFYLENDGLEAFTQNGLSVPGFYSLASSVTPPLIHELRTKRQVNSLYEDVRIGYKNLAFAEATLRNDFASTQPSAARAFSYPSISGSFIPSELLHNVSWLSYWKLRGSWTEYKTPANIYDINNVYDITPNDWGTLTGASFPTSIHPTTIQPQGANTVEIGTDAAFLKNRIQLNVSLYKKRMYDFIVEATVPSSSGFSSVFTNSKEQHTQRGIEVTLNATPVQSTDFSWNIGINWTKYATYFTKLDPQFSLVNKDYVGIGKRVDYVLEKQFQTDPSGNVVFKNGLPVKLPFNQLGGYSDPDWIWGITNSLKYKRFTLAFTVDGRVGGTTMGLTETYMMRSGNAPATLTEARALDAATPGSKNFLGDGVQVVSGAITYDANGHVVSDTRTFAPNSVNTTYQAYVNAIYNNIAWGATPSPYDLHSETYLKLREASLTYQFSPNLARKIGAKAASVSAIGQNLIYWSKGFKFSDIDGGSEDLTGPSMRYIGVNIKLNF